MGKSAASLVWLSQLPIHALHDKRCIALTWDRRPAVVMQLHGIPHLCRAVPGLPVSASSALQDLPSIVVLLEEMTAIVVPVM